MAKAGSALGRTVRDDGPEVAKHFPAGLGVLNDAVVSGEGISLCKGPPHAQTLRDSPAGKSEQALFDRVCGKISAEGIFRIFGSPTWDRPIEKSLTLGLKSHGVELMRRGAFPER